MKEDEPAKIFPSLPAATTPPAVPTTSSDAVLIGSGRGRPRHKIAVISRTYRCPIYDCRLPKADVRQHLRHCHPYLIPAEISELIKTVKLSEPAQSPSLRKFSCSLCGAVVRRLRVHLTGRHKMTPISDGFKKAMVRSRIILGKALPMISSARNRRYHCPICSAVVKKLGVHLSGRHSFSKETPAYQISMQASRIEYDGVDEGISLRNFIGQFKEHLKSYNGGSRPSRSAEGHGNRVERVLSELCRNEKRFNVWTAVFRVRNIGNIGGVLDRLGNEEKLGAGTLLCYVDSLILLIKYLMMYPEKVPVKRVFSSRYEQLTAFLTTLNSCRKTLVKKRCIETRRRRVSEASLFVEPAILGLYVEGNLMNEVVDMLTSVADGRLEPTVKRFCIIRDRLLFCVLITNFCRAGDIINLTVNELRDVRLTENHEGDRIVIVSEHKQASTYYSRLNLFQPLYQHVTDYINAFRSLVFDQCSFVFPSVADEARQMTHGEFHKAVNRIWNEHRLEIPDGEQLPVSVTASKFRKWVITRTHRSANREEQEDLAGHMTHSWQVARQYYDISLGVEQTSRVTQRLRWMMEGSSGTVRSLRYLTVGKSAIFCYSLVKLQQI
jgi:integrase